MDKSSAVTMATYLRCICLTEDGELCGYCILNVVISKPKWSVSNSPVKGGL